MPEVAHVPVDDLKPPIDDPRLHDEVAGKDSAHASAHAAHDKALSIRLHAPAFMHVLAIDAGTTGVTCLVLRPDQSVAGRAHQEFTQHHPAPGLAEHDALEIATTTVDVARQAMAAAGIGADEVAALGIANQRETTVIWDRETGQPIHRALVWQDRRTADACAKLAKHEKRVRDKTGLVIDSYFCATKIAWILDNVEGARTRAERGELAFGTIDTWLAWFLTGGRLHVTDPTNASRTLLWNIESSTWSGELCQLFRVPQAILPTVRPTSGVLGTVDPEHLGAPVPLASLVGDQQAALFGQGAVAPGDAKNTYGTGCFLLQHTGRDPVLSKHGLLTTRVATLDGSAQFALEGSVFVGGQAVQWLRDGLEMVSAAPEVDQLALRASTDGVMVVPALTGLAAPHWDAAARGAILGLTPGATRADIARATLEGIAHQCQDVLDAMEKDSGQRISCLHVDGGASRSDPLMQFQADLLGHPVARAGEVEATALGAGLLAGHAVDFWAKAEPTEPTTVYEPAMPPKEVRARRKRWKKAVKLVRAFGS